jgi:hypothetical protein
VAVVGKGGVAPRREDPGHDVTLPGDGRRDGHARLDLQHPLQILPPAAAARPRGIGRDLGRITGDQQQEPHPHSLLEVPDPAWQKKPAVRHPSGG